MFQVIWPNKCKLTEAHVMIQAQDDVANGKTDLPMPTTIEEAITVILDSGSLTFVEM